MSEDTAQQNTSVRNEQEQQQAAAGPKYKDDQEGFVMFDDTASRSTIDPDFKPSADSDSSDEYSQESEPVRPPPRPRRTKAKSQPSQTRKRKQKSEVSGPMFAKRPKFTEERRRTSQLPLELNAAEARKHKEVDCEHLELPPVAYLRELTLLGDKECVDFRLHTFFTCGPELYKELQANPLIKGFRVRFWRNNNPRECYIHAICGHLVKTVDEHKLCRSCEYAARRTLCFLPDECDICMEQTDKSNLQRRDRASRTKSTYYFTTVGGRREARDLLGRWYYLEGMLWHLAAVYERAVNVPALRQCRRNILELSALQAPPLPVQAHTPLACDTDRPKDKKHVPKKALSQVQTSRRGERAISHVAEHPDLALARLERKVNPKAVIKPELMPIPDRAHNRMPVELYIDDSELMSTEADLAEYRRNGYMSMRHEYRVRFYYTSMPSLTSEEQRRMRLERKGIDPNTPIGKYKPARRNKKTAKQRCAALRNSPPPKKLPAIAQVQAAEEQAVSQDDWVDSEYDLVGSSWGAASPCHSFASVPPPHTTIEEGNELHHAGGPSHTPFISKLPPMGVVRDQLLSGKPPPLPSTFASHLQNVRVKVRRSDRLAAKQEMVGSAGNDISASEKVLQKQGGKKRLLKKARFVRAHAWKRIRFLRYRIALYLKIKPPVVPVFPFDRYYYRPRPPKPFVLYRADQILDHINTRNAQVKENEELLRFAAGTTVLTEQEMASIRRVARLLETNGPIAGTNVTVTPQPNQLNVPAGIRQKACPKSKKRPIKAAPSPAETAPSRFTSRMDQLTLSEDEERWNAAARKHLGEGVSVGGSVRQATEPQERADNSQGSSTEQMIEKVVAEQLLENEQVDLEDGDEPLDLSMASTHCSEHTAPAPETAKMVETAQLSPKDRIEDWCRDVAEATAEGGPADAFQEEQTPPPPHTLPVTELGIKRVKVTALTNASDAAVIKTLPHAEVQAEPHSAQAMLQLQPRGLIPISATAISATETVVTAVPVVQFTSTHVTATAPTAAVTASSAEAQREQGAAAVSQVTLVDVSAANQEQESQMANSPSMRVHSFVQQQKAGPPAPSEEKEESKQTVSTPHTSGDEHVGKSSEEEAVVDAVKQTVESEQETTPGEKEQDEVMAVDEELHVDTAGPTGERRDSLEPPSPKSPDAASYVEIAGLPLGTLTEKQWKEFCFRCDLQPDARPIVQQILDESNGLVDLLNEHNIRVPVKTAIVIDNIINHGGEDKLPSMTDVCQLTLTLNRFFLKYKNYIDDKASPCDELSTVCGKTYEKIRRELMPALTAAKQALKTGEPTENIEEDDVTTSLANQVLDQVNKLVERMTLAETHQKAHNVALAQRNCLSRENEQLRKQLKDAHELEERITARAHDTRIRAEELEKRALAAEAMNKSLLTAHAEALEKQRVEYCKIIEDQKNEIHDKEKRRRAAQNAYAEEYRKHRQTREEMPASTREAQILRKQLSQACADREITRKKLVDTEVKLDWAEQSFGSTVNILGAEGNFLYAAAQSLAQPPGPPIPGVAATGPTLPNQPNLQQPTTPHGAAFNEGVSRLKAERRHVSELIPEDLMSVEPMVPNQWYAEGPNWDFYFI